MKKVLMVAENDLSSKGGIQHVMSSISKNLNSEFIFDAVVFKKTDASEKSNFPEYQNIFTVPCGSNNRILSIIENIARPLRLMYFSRKIIKAGNYDAVHVHDTIKGVWFLRAAGKLNVPVRLMHCHNPENREKCSAVKKAYNRITIKLMKKYSNVKIGCSMAACDSLFGKNCGAFVVNNETDLEIFNTDAYPRENNGEKIRFIHVGRFTYQKNHDFLLKVFKIIHNELPDSDLTLIGWGELENSIKQTVGELGLQSCVSFCPKDSNVAEYMSRADYMIFPSRYEGLGRVLIEAQAMGVMCFASDVVPGETDLGMCEYLSINDDETVWARQILEIIKEKRDNYSLNKDKLKKFDLKEVIGAYADIYNGKK